MRPAGAKWTGSPFSAPIRKEEKQHERQNYRPVRIPGRVAQRLSCTADLPCGFNLGNISLCHVSVPTADIGLLQLAMYSCFESAGVKDAGYLMGAMAVYYSQTLVCPSDGCYEL